MIKHCMVFESDKMYIHTHCYETTDNIWFNVFELEAMFYHAIDIIAIGESFQIHYGQLSEDTKIWLLIERDSFLKFFPILFHFYYNTRGGDKIGEKLLCFYSCWKNRMNYSIEQGI